MNDELRRFASPFLRRFAGNRLAMGILVGLSVAVMLGAGVGLAMITEGSPESEGNAKPSSRDSTSPNTGPRDSTSPNTGPRDSTSHDGGPRDGTSHDGASTPRQPGPTPHPPGSSHGLATWFDNGTHFVGGAIAAGTYSTAGSNGDPAGCEWSRLADNGGELVTILSGYAEGPTHVTVNDGEYIRSTGCQTWKKSG